MREQEAFVCLFVFCGEQQFMEEGGKEVVVVGPQPPSQPSLLHSTAAHSWWRGQSSYESMDLCLQWLLALEAINLPSFCLCLFPGKPLFPSATSTHPSMHGKNIQVSQSARLSLFFTILLKTFLSHDTYKSLPSGAS